MVEEAKGGDLEAVFHSFAAKAKEINGKQFAKMAKDTKILCKSLTSTDIDPVFAKHMTKGVKKMTYAQFKGALVDMAKKKKITEDQLIEKIVAAGGPAYAGTKADKVKWHDDKELYTGVYAAGGPTNVDAKPFYQGKNEDGGDYK